MTGDDYRLDTILVNADEDGGGVKHGRELVAFVDAVLGADPAALAVARRDVIAALGPEAFVDVCATVASFNAVVKIADGTGIPLEAAKAERTRELRASLGIDAFDKRRQEGS